MIRIAVAASLAFLLASAALAEGAPPAQTEAAATQQAGPGEEMIVVGDAFNLLKAINDMSWREEVVDAKDEKGQPTKQLARVQVFYPANTAWILKDDAKILKAFVDQASEVSREMGEAAKKANGGEMPKQGTSAYKELDAKVQEFWKSKKPIKKLSHVKRIDLGAQKEFSPAMLDALDPIVDP